jgi:dipeptidyl aminopeptidase/acylaminoacyl peptidase
MMVGGKDVRVPMAQSMDYYKILRARGVEARLLHFPDAQHALADSVKDDDEVWATVVSWFQQHVRRQLVQNVDNSCPG